MKVLHLAHGLGGGAGRAAQRISEACRAVGMQSAVLNVANPARQDGVYQAERCKLLSAGECMDFHLSWKYLEQQSRGVSNSLFSLPYPSVDLLSHPLVQQADIVNLHWVTWVLAPHHIRQLAQQKPVVWTLHDFWAVTGGCHYPSGCKQYETECFSCPQIDDKLGVVAASFLDKRLNLADLEHLHACAPSAALSDAVSKSRVLAGKTVTPIPNPIELDIFHPVDDRLEKRRALGITDGDCVLVFGNYANSERRKGGEILREALDLLFGADLEADQKFVIIAFGSGYRLPASDRVKTLSFNTISDDGKLRDILAMADVLCFPSVEDNYPNTIIEAAACGTPAIAYRAGGMQEMVVDGETGILIDELGSAAGFRDAILAFQNRYFGDQTMRHQCRMVAERVNNYSVAGQRYQALYEAALLKFSDTGKLAKGAWGDAPANPVQEQFLKTLGASMTDTMCDAFWGFPLRARLEKYLEWDGSKNPRLREKLWRQPVLVPAPWRAGRQKLLMVATHHGHHAAHSGPLQFARHLDRDQFDWRYMKVPLGEYLAEEPEKFTAVCAQLRAWSLPVLASQLGALLAELHLVQAFLQDERVADLVHFIDGDHSGFLAPLALRALGIQHPRFVTTLHQPPATLKTAVAPALMTGFDRLCLMADSQVPVFAAMSTAPAAVVTPHGVDTDFYTPRPHRVPTGGKQVRLVSVGHWLRDYETAFVVVDRLLQSGYQVEYRIIGAPATMQFPTFVTPLNGLTDEELRAEYQQADLFFMPLHESTANNAILEAMACGLPVVSTDVGGVSFMTGGDAARLCAPSDVAAYAAAITAVLEDAETWRRMAAAARTRAGLFDWRRVARQMNGLYADVLATPHQTRLSHAPEAMLGWNGAVFAGHPYGKLISDIGRHADAGMPLGDELTAVVRQYLLKDYASLQDVDKYPVLLALARLGSMLPCG